MLQPLRHFLCLILGCSPLSAAADIHTDIAIYGGTASGVMAAVQAARMGTPVVLLEPGQHIGGASVEGLGSTDIDNHKEFKNGAAVGGLARDFYLRIGRAYGKDGPVYKFEPHVAEQVFQTYITELQIPVHLGHRLKEQGGVALNSTTHRITSITMENGVTVHAKIFIDATIEGDLLAFAGISHVIGRESTKQYGETKNGILNPKVNVYRQFEIKVDPYQTPGDPNSGLIPTIQDQPYGNPGDADAGIQGYCFRLCFTKNPDNRIPFSKPDSYDRSQYEIYLRYLAAGGKLFSPHANLPNEKTDLGSWHDLSLNLYGMNWGYPGGGYAEREKILKDHLSFTQGLCYFLANDPAVPVATRTAWNPWGTCKDEFQGNHGWPRMFYVRDARRMVSDYVITEHHTQRYQATPVEDPVCVAYWPPDTHHVRRIVKDGHAYNEGFVFGGDTWGPFGISYRALVPKSNECTNLLVPSCPSSTHVAYGAIRLEWTFMALGQAVGTAAVQAIQNNVDVQAVAYPSLRAQLLKDQQILHVPSR